MTIYSINKSAGEISVIGNDTVGQNAADRGMISQRFLFLTDPRARQLAPKRNDPDSLPVDNLGRK
jgi:hypothetical protein